VARTGRPFFRQGANAGILILERYFFPSENLISHCGFIPPPRSVMTTGGLCLSQTRRTSGGSLALPAGSSSLRSLASKPSLCYTSTSWTPFVSENTVSPIFHHLSVCTIHQSNRNTEPPREHGEMEIFRSSGAACRLLTAPQFWWHGFFQATSASALLK